MPLSAESQPTTSNGDTSGNSLLSAESQPTTSNGETSGNPLLSAESQPTTSSGDTSGMYFVLFVLYNCTELCVLYIIRLQAIPKPLLCLLQLPMC